MNNYERVFLSGIKKSLEEKGVFFHKIADMPHFRGSGTKFDLKKPFDAFGIYFGIPFAIEAKYIPEIRGFGIKQLSENQIEGLNQFEIAGGRSFVFLNIRQFANPKLARSRFNRLIIFPWKQLKRKEKYAKSEIMAMPSIDGIRSRFNLDEFLINLILESP